MTPFAWLIGLLLPACGATGARGLPTPSPLDLGHLQRPASPNTAFAAPAGTAPSPDIMTPAFGVPAARLYKAVIAVAVGQPRTFLAAAYPTERQAHFVVRSAVLNFPDLVTAQVDDAGPDASSLVLYSRSVYGYSDLGVNRQRLSAWLAALQSKINHHRHEIVPMRGLRSFLHDSWHLARPYYRSEEKWSAWGLLLSILALRLLLVGMTVILSFWNREFFNSLQDKDFSAFGNCCSSIVRRRVASCLVSVRSPPSTSWSQCTSLTCPSGCRSVGGAG